MATRENSFGLDVRRLLQLVEGRCDEVARKTVLKIGTSLVYKSPVGKPWLWKHKAPKGYVGGRFVANWQYGVNVAPSGTLDAIDPSGAATIGRMGARIDQSPGMGVIHVFANNLPYAVPLEYGHSKQTPGGMVRLTALEFNQYVQQAVAEASARRPS